MKKPKYYRLTNILKHNPNYIMLLGERSNGKSYSVKEYCLRNAYEKGEEMVYLRRFDRDLTVSNVSRYFSDISITTLTNNEYSGIDCYRGEIFFCNFDEKYKAKRGKKIGYYIALNNDERTKSQSFPNVKNIVYEEFITDKLYLQDEPTRLQNLVSTVLRHRQGLVFLIGNTINRVCPYFSEWDLRNIPKQKPGSIDDYDYKRINDKGEEFTTRISVEFCEDCGIKSSMFFGKASESIDGANWSTKEMPRLPEPKENYNMLYEVELTDCGFSFILQLLSNKDGGVIVFCYPLTKKNRNINRKITEIFSDNPLTTPSFNDRIKAEVKMRECIYNNKICFSDNMTGTDFMQVLASRKERL